jgi:crossover junction endodeoxyribonuclease RuvC
MTWRRVVGIDPGTAGAFAILNGTGVVLVDDLPVHMVTASGRGLRAELDLHQLRRVLTEHLPFDHAYVERVAARPGQGVTSMFRFGMAYGSILGVLAALDVPLTLVLPTHWQRHHGCGPAPDAARQRATQLYPAMADRLARKKDGNRADALLLAAYGLSVGSLSGGGGGGGSLLPRAASNNANTAASNSAKTSRTCDVTF